MDESPKRYIAICRLEAKREGATALDAMKAVKRLVDRWSKGQAETIGQADQGYFSAFVLLSAKPAGMMTAEFRNEPGIGPRDSMIIIEAGEDFASAGFSLVGTWLQRRSVGKSPE